MDMTAGGLVIPTTPSLSRSYELLLLAHTGIVKVNLDKMEVYVKTKPPEDKIYTLPIYGMIDAENLTTTDKSKVVQVYCGSERYGSAVVAVIRYVHH